MVHIFTKLNLNYISNQSKFCNHFAKNIFSINLNKSQFLIVINLHYNYINFTLKIR